MPLAGEDYTMQPWGYNAVPATFIGRIGAMWHKVYYSALMWNPRIGEGLTTITAAFPKLIFDILNTLLFIWLIFVLFVIGFGRFPDWKKPSDGFAFFSIFFLIITLCPLLGQIFIWKAGTSNHTWGSILLLSFILPFRLNYYKRVHIKQFPILLLYIILGFFAGLSVENSSVVVLATLLVLFVIFWKQKRIDKNFIYPLISFAIGVYILLFSPGTTIRRNYYAGQGYDANYSGINLYIHRLLRIGADFLKITWPLLLVFIACLVVYIIIMTLEKSRKTGTAQESGTKKLSLLEIFFMLIVATLSAMILISVAYQSDQRRGFEFFWLIIIAISAYLLTDFWNRISSRYVHSAVLILSLLLLGFQAFTMGKVYSQLNSENAARIAIIDSALKTGEKAIILPKLTIQDSRIVETREILSDLSTRIAGYYGFTQVEIQK